MDNDGAIVGGTIAEKTALCVKNCQAVLAEAGSSIEKVVKTTVFLSDMALFAVRPTPPPHVGFTGRES